MSDQSKQGDAPTKSELSEEDLETVAGGTMVTKAGKGNLVKVLGQVGGQLGGGTGQTPGQQATEGMSPSQIEGSGKPPS